MYVHETFFILISIIVDSFFFTLFILWKSTNLCGKYLFDYIFSLILIYDSKIIIIEINLNLNLNLVSHME